MTAPVFHKSSRSYETGACVEVAEGPTALVRDSTTPAGTTLHVPASEWAAILGAIR